MVRLLTKLLVLSLLTSLGLLSCGGGGGSSTPVPTGSAPTITSFRFTASPVVIGQQATLEWSTTGADTVSIDHGIGIVTNNGSLSVQIPASGDYVLTAKNKWGSPVATAHIDVDRMMLTPLTRASKINDLVSFACTLPPGESPIWSVVDGPLGFTATPSNGGFTFSSPSAGVFTIRATSSADPTIYTDAIVTVTAEGNLELKNNIVIIPAGDPSGPITFGPGLDGISFQATSPAITRLSSGKIAVLGDPSIAPYSKVIRIISKISSTQFTYAVANITDYVLNYSNSGPINALAYTQQALQAHSRQDKGPLKFATSQIGSISIPLNYGQRVNDIVAVEIGTSGNLTLTPTLAVVPANGLKLTNGGLNKFSIEMGFAVSLDLTGYFRLGLAVKAPLGSTTYPIILVPSPLLDIPLTVAAVQPCFLFSVMSDTEVQLLVSRGFDLKISANWDDSIGWTFPDPQVTWQTPTFSLPRLSNAVTTIQLSLPIVFGAIDFRDKTKCLDAIKPSLSLTPSIGLVCNENLLQGVATVDWTWGVDWAADASIFGSLPSTAKGVLGTRHLIGATERLFDFQTHKPFSVQTIVTPSSALVTVGGSQNFNAISTVSGLPWQADIEPNYIWTIDNPSAGTLSNFGVFNATTAPISSSATIRAIPKAAQGDPNAAGSATVAIERAPIHCEMQIIPRYNAGSNGSNYCADTTILDNCGASITIDGKTYNFPKFPPSGGSPIEYLYFDLIPGKDYQITWTIFNNTNCTNNCTILPEYCFDMFWINWGLFKINSTYPYLESIDAVMDPPGPSQSTRSGWGSYPSAVIDGQTKIIIKTVTIP